MKSRARLAACAAVLMLLTAAQEPPPGEGPRGTSGAGEARVDLVGYAQVGEGQGISVALTALPIDSVVEVTSIETGRTTLAFVAPGQGGRGEIAVISAGTARAIGATGTSVPVRVRPVIATPPEVAGLRAGQPTDRGTAPAPLLAALRKKLPARAAAPVAAPPRKPVVKSAPAPTAKPTPVPTVAKPKPVPAPVASPKPAGPVPAPAPAVAGGFAVQVATLSSADRAQALAARIGGRVAPQGKLFRVQSRALPDAVAAERERARIAKLGFPDARVVRTTP